jgi:FAD:protein FMN transferase
MLQSSDSPCAASRLRIGMGTFIAIDAEANTAQSTLSGIKSAFAVVAQVERLMHPTRTGSDLAAIHRGRLGAPLAVHAWTWEVLALSRKLNRVSQRVFDPCLPELAGSFADLELMPPRTVIPHAPLRIDLGGIAKGYAVDRALMALRAAGCHGGLVNAGGDLAVFGDRSHPIVVKGRDGGSTVVDLMNAALATSEAGNATRPAEHRGYYDGTTGREIRSGRVTVSAASAAVADALTKCLLAIPGEMHAALLESFDARLVGYEANP